ncbi:MAG: S-methyl-5'-thioadenosine phosphorylase [Kiritimatiellia bacterium]|nr:S-methyl-5'-thioadenosine phosphorylase [Kiritimatiellia bacterium]
MKIGILGGSGLYELEALKDLRRHAVPTPFGDPSDDYLEGVWKEREVVFLPRHGVGHRLLPSEINHRANIFGFKSLGVHRVISVSAVGSLKEELRPRDVVLPDQYFDRTKRGDAQTFFGKGVVAHVAFGDPVCGDLLDSLFRAAEQTRKKSDRWKDLRIQMGGTYVNMEGPAFSTRAESNWYRSCGFDVIGMTSLAEAKLCREAGLCYAALAMVTDYDCWHETEEDVTTGMVIETLRANIDFVRHILENAVFDAGQTRTCDCEHSLKNALFTPPDRIPPERRKALGPILEGIV